MRRAAVVTVAEERYFSLKFRYAPLQLLNGCRLVCRSMPIALQYGSQRGYRASQRRHRLLMPAFRFRPILPPRTLGFRPILSTVAATVPAVKVIGQQLRHSKNGQYNGDVSRAFKVL